MSRKTLTNEVLPRPAETPSSSVRDRVVQNARRLLTNGAVAGSAFVTACYTVVDPLPPPCPAFSHQYLPEGTATLTGNNVTVTFSTLSGWNGGWDEDLRRSGVRNVHGGQLTGPDWSPLSFDLDPDVSTLSFEVLIRCEGSSPDPVWLQVTVDLTTGADGGPALDPPVTVRISGESADGG